MSRHLRYRHNRRRARQALANNRWGVKLGWTNAYVTADAGLFGAQTDLGSATDFSSDTDKSLQWHVAYAPFDRPLQVGLYGNVGTSPLSLGAPTAIRRRASTRRLIRLHIHRACSRSTNAAGMPTPEPEARRPERRSRHHQDPP